MKMSGWNGCGIVADSLRWSFRTVIGKKLVASGYQRFLWLVDQGEGARRKGRKYCK